jgi:hypothetical protein
MFIKDFANLEFWTLIFQTEMMQDSKLVKPVTFEPVRGTTSINQSNLFQWPCNTSSENSSKSKTNTNTEKTVLKLVKIQSLRKISLISRTL